MLLDTAVLDTCMLLKFCFSYGVPTACALLWIQHCISNAMCCAKMGRESLVPSVVYILGTRKSVRTFLNMEVELQDIGGPVNILWPFICPVLWNGRGKLLVTRLVPICQTLCPSIPYAITYNWKSIWFFKIFITFFFCYIKHFNRYKKTKQKTGILFIKRVRHVLPFTDASNSNKEGTLQKKLAIFLMFLNSF